MSDDVEKTEIGWNKYSNLLCKENMFAKKSSIYCICVYVHTLSLGDKLFFCQEGIELKKFLLS